MVEDDKRGGARELLDATLRDARAMTVIEQARERGFELEERPLAGQWVWGWQRGEDTRWPCFLTEREALSYMADRLTHTAVFA